MSCGKPKQQVNKSLSYRLFLFLHRSVFLVTTTNPYFSPPNVIIVRTPLLPVGKARHDDLRAHLLQIESGNIFKKSLSGCNKSNLTTYLKLVVELGNADSVAFLNDVGADESFWL